MIAIFGDHFVTIMEIQGQGFKLRGWEKDDAEPLQRHADNKNIFDFLFDRFPSPYTMDDAVDFVQGKLEQHPILSFVIEVDGTPAGVIGIEKKEDIYCKSAQLGYWLSEDHWGKGIMTQAVKMAIAYAFTNLDIVRLQSSVNGNNPRSMRVLEKAGFTKDGILKSNIFKNGGILDEHIYGIVK
jgi:ribosomal-protein-alanine N-acetyltransferase